MINIKLLFEFLIKIFLRYKRMISGIWCLDLISALIVAFRPIVIAFTIDNLLINKVNWLIYLLGLEAIYWIVNVANQYFDTRVYTKILRIQCEEYYAMAVSHEIDDSTIAARTYLIEDFTGFLEQGLPNIVKTTVNVIIACVYLYYETTPVVVILVIIVSLVVIRLSCSWQKDIVVNHQKRKNEGENEQRIIKTRNSEHYSLHLKSIFKLDILSSDIEAKSFFVCYFLQIALLACAITSLLILGNLKAGVIYATITYVLELNSEVREIPDHYFTVMDLVDSASRVIM